MTDQSKVVAMRDFHDMSHDERGRAIQGAMWPQRNVTVAFGRPSAMIGRTKLFLADADPACAADVACGLERFYQDFPHVAANLQQVNVLDLPSGCYAATAEWHDGRFDISLNRMVYGHGRRSFLIDHAAEDYRNGFHRFTTPTGSFEHELGHVIDMSTGNLGAMSLDYNDALGISGYAVRGGAEEAFAEAFANWREGVHNSQYVDDVVAGVARYAQRSGRVAA